MEENYHKGESIMSPLAEGRELKCLVHEVHRIAENRRPSRRGVN